MNSFTCSDFAYICGIGKAIINSKCSVPEILVHFFFLCMEIFLGVFVKSGFFSLWFYFFSSIFLFILLHISLNISFIPLCDF